MATIQCVISEERMASLENLMKDAGITTIIDLFNCALNFFEWVIKETRSGMIIASIDEKTKGSNRS